MRSAIAVGADVYLRRPARADADEFTTCTRASVDLHAGYVDAASTETEFLAWLARGDRADTEQFLICTRDDDAIVGFTNLNTIIRGALQQAFASWAAFAGAEGAGRISAGVELALRVAFTALRLHRIEANIQPGNARSRALAVRCGFRLEGYSPDYLQIGGEWRDHERWAITEPEWRARAAAPSKTATS